MGAYQTVHYEVEAFQVNIEDAAALADVIAWCSGWMSEDGVMFHGSDSTIVAGHGVWIVKLTDGSFTRATVAQFTYTYEAVPA